MLIDAPKERRFLFVPDAGRVEIRIEICFSVVVSRHFMPFAAFLVKSNPGTLSVLVIIFDAHMDHRRSARKYST